MNQSNLMEFEKEEAMSDEKEGLEREIRPVIEDSDWDIADEGLVIL